MKAVGATAGQHELAKVAQSQMERYSKKAKYSRVAYRGRACFSKGTLATSAFE